MPQIFIITTHYFKMSKYPFGDSFHHAEYAYLLTDALSSCHLALLLPVVSGATSHLYLSGPSSLTSVFLDILARPFLYQPHSLSCHLLLLLLFCQMNTDQTSPTTALSHQSFVHPLSKEYVTSMFCTALNM